MSDLRTRIAAVCSEEIRRQQYDKDPQKVWPLLNSLALSDAIIKHLQLTEDSGVIVGCTHG